MSLTGDSRAAGRGGSSQMDGRSRSEREPEHEPDDEEDGPGARRITTSTGASATTIVPTPDVFW